MGLNPPNVKEHFALKLLSLSNLEIQELLTFLFRKLGYRIEDMLPEGDLLYLHLAKQEQEKIEHCLACWTGSKRILAADFVQSFLKNPPFSPADGVHFEKGFFLSPYAFGTGFKQEALKFQITLLSGDELSNLLIQQGLTYYFPSFLGALGKMVIKKLPWVVTPILVIYAFLMVQTLKSGPLPSIVSVRPSPGSSTSPPPLSTGNARVSLLGPSFAVEIQKPDELYSRMDLAKEPLKKPTQKETTHLKNPSHTEIESPPPIVPTPPPVIQTPPPQLRHPIQRPTPKPTLLPPPNLRPTPPRRPPQGGHTASAGSIINRYKNMVDLENKYYSIARELEKQHYKAKAKTYYQKYLKVAPDGDFAEQAREALKRL